MRVIAGSARRTPLKCVSGLDTRPTTDRIKETLFNMIQESVVDCDFLDLFAGSGAIAIEALSRGAVHAVCVEKNLSCVAYIKENLMATKLEKSAEILAVDIITSLKKLEGRQPFDIIFMDPPYDQELEKQVLHYLKDSSLMGKDTMVIVEASLTTSFDYLEELNMKIEKIKKYRSNTHVFIFKCEV